MPMRPAPLRSVLVKLAWLASELDRLAAFIRVRGVLSAEKSAPMSIVSAEVGAPEVGVVPPRRPEQISLELRPLQRRAGEVGAGEVRVLADIGAGEVDPGQVD